MAIFNGGSGDDLIVGSNKADRIKGGLGNDTIFGAGGDDELNGNRDNDLIFGGEGEDTIRGNRGNDTLVGDTGNDRMIGGMGDDRLIWNNGDGSDIMKGGRGYDVVEVNGAVDDGDDFELRANGNRAEFERLNLINFTLDVDNVEKFEINGLGGDDTLVVQDLSGTDVETVSFDGGAGNDWLDASSSNVAIIADGGMGEDLLSGSSVREIADTLEGGEGNDTVIGNLGNDLMSGGLGDDRLIWNNGDGSDIMEGGNGYDVVEVNGAVDDGDDFELRANGDRAEFERLNLINFTLDVDDVEKFDINGLGGDDTLVVQDLSSTDVQQVHFDGGMGDDLLDASLSNVAIMADGGAGEDLLSGSSVREIADTLNGGDDNDTVIGNLGNDLMIGGEGDDRLIWNNGDGSDIMEGGNGYDVVEVNGAVLDGDDFELRANGDRAEFERLNLINFTLDVDDVEKFEINGLGGDDTLTVEDLSGTDVETVSFDGGAGDDLLDASLSNVAVLANGGDDNDTLISGTANDILIGGNGDNNFTGGEGADIFVVGFDGIDVINDFNRAEGDTLQILASVGTSSLDSLEYDSSSGDLYLNNNQIAVIDVENSDFGLDANIELV